MAGSAAAHGVVCLAHPPHHPHQNTPNSLPVPLIFNGASCDLTHNFNEASYALTQTPTGRPTQVGGPRAQPLRLGLRGLPHAGGVATRPWESAPPETVSGAQELGFTNLLHKIVIGICLGILKPSKMPDPCRISLPDPCRISQLPIN